MGCCYSCKEDGSTQGGEVSERTHLLVDPVSNNTNIQRVQSDDFIGCYSSSLPKKTDEQSALNRILQETATNVIDVAALDSHNLEQHEYLDRVKHYTQKLQSMSRWTPPRRPPCLLVDIPAPEKLLASEPLTQQDMNLITTTVEEANAALAELRVEHKEDLVVPFRIP
ncbi:Ragulator complex protein LAMTOR1 [Cryptotermes secundus]|uniref:Ragulator complex protein LAMTOR1 n=1 Tax=Cryptotermes secundus TaxID=105785 RepID=A0A2J7R3A9_9NEOP|nr:ragulator complex protein LAMTOR1 [Cryptotermes secundus]PNF35312.1 Ragulator complex protein LAMTOR1 [Cryptotermes secundus]